MDGALIHEQTRQVLEDFSSFSWEGVCTCSQLLCVPCFKLLDTIAPCFFSQRQVALQAPHESIAITLLSRRFRPLGREVLLLECLTRKGNQVMVHLLGLFAP